MSEPAYKGINYYLVKIVEAENEAEIHDVLQEMVTDIARTMED